MTAAVYADILVSTGLPRPLLSIDVRGNPAPQGSKKFVGVSRAGHGILVESSKKVAPWREDVHSAALNLIRCRCPDPMCVALAPPFPLDEPLLVSMTFTLPKPQSAPKTRQSWPMRHPDVSKLARSTEDALTHLVWADDARIVGYMRLCKVYPSEGTDALPEPGAIIRVWRYTPTLEDL